METRNVLNALEGMIWVKKASIFLLSLDHVLNNFEAKSDTQIKCAEAVDRCWSWLGGRSVSADDLAYYLDSDEMQEGPLGEHNFASDSVGQNSLILVLLVVGFVANQAYRASGLQDKMSASICEADEGAAEYIVDYIFRLGMGGVFSIYMVGESCLE